METSDGLRTAFFVYTEARADKSGGTTNKLATILSVVLLLITNIIVALQLYWFDYGDGYDANDSGWCIRCLACLILCTVFVARVTVQCLYFWDRRITWEEIVVEKMGIIPASLCSLAYGCVQNRNVPIGMVDVFGFLLSLAGTAMNLIPEAKRTAWKAKPENKGKLYTGNLFQYCRRVNYTGEIIAFIGHAIICGPRYWWLINMWVAFFMGLGLVFYSVPEIEFYLQRRYGAQWETYCKQVPWKMLPGVW
eukprot:m.342776 g.342776  ORF g.342776 m.342776 type:complete len:250 (+) comp21819_c0_seq1:215-964(+)